MFISGRPFPEKKIVLCFSIHVNHSLFIGPPSPQVLEKGNAYLTLGFKGLELQETSCHSLEATRIDNIFEAAFEAKALVNSFPFHALSPLGQLEVLLYSESQQVLDEVMKNRKTFKLIAESFMESMVFLLVDFAKKYNRRQKSAPGWYNYYALVNIN